MTDYTAMTMDTLQAEFVRLAAVVAEASDARNAILKIIEARKASAIAKFKIDSATEIEKDALRSVLGGSAIGIAKLP